ncbi:hypothetical protein CspHIS471_0705520 [Cutaneotrichosporon sp. HIS471]|nr:hypothetical protein CspHIS471_0705520 [Cutaneotrichosporon sp. HIS471]
MSAPQPTRQATDPYQAKLERMRANAADDSTRPFMDDSHVSHDNLTPEQARAYALWGNSDATGPPASAQNDAASNVEAQPHVDTDAIYKAKIDRMRANAADDSTRPFIDDTNVSHENLTPEQARAYAFWGNSDATGPKDANAVPASNVPAAPARQTTDPYQVKLDRVRANVADDSTRPFMDDSHIPHENLTPEQARAYALWGSPDATGPQDSA